MAEIGKEDYYYYFNLRSHIIERLKPLNSLQQALSESIPTILTNSDSDKIQINLELVIRRLITFLVKVYVYLQFQKFLRTLRTHFVKDSVTDRYRLVAKHINYLCVDCNAIKC